MFDYNRSPGKTAGFSLLIFLILGLGLVSFPLPAAGAQEDNLDQIVSLTRHRSILSGGVDLANLEAILKRGTLFIVDETTPEEIPWLVTAGIIINAPLEEVWKVITDFSRYYEWVPQTEKTVSQTQGRRVDIEHTLGFKFFFFHTRIRYSIADILDYPRRLDWVGTGGEVEKNYGYMEFFPAENGQKTLFFFTAWALPQSVLLKKFLEREPVTDLIISMSAASIYVKRLKERVEKNLAVPPPPPSPQPDLVKAPVETLMVLSSRGPVVLVEDPGTSETGPGETPLVSSWAIFDAPPERVFSEITDYSRQSEYLPTLDSIKWISRDKTSGVTERKQSIQLPVFSARMKCQFSEELVSNRKVSWTYLSGEPFVSSGSWELIPLAEGKKTLGFYRNRFSFNSLGVMLDVIMKAIPDAPVAVKAVVSTTAIRAMRDWIETPPEARGKLMSLSKKKRVQEIRRLAEERAKKEQK